MAKQQSVCPYCKKEFQKKHGNQIYCAPTCKNAQKAMSQAKLYSILKDFRKGFLNNYNLFSSLLPKVGTKMIALSELNNQGFKSNCYFGAYIDKNKNGWYKVHNYSFSIMSKEQSYFVTIINS